MPYKAFISYSHAVDGQLAPALQSGLQRIAKPFYRLRAMRIFRDETSLHLTPKLWPTIQQALSESEHFILMASSTATGSKWVQDEIDEWLQLRSGALDKFHLVLTEGDILWDKTVNDFDWEKTTALPQNLRGKFQTEPLYLDFRWARESEHLSLRNPPFLKAIGKLAATIRDEPLDLLIGEDVRQHRAFKLVAGVTIVLLSALLVATSAVAYYANEKRKEALNAVKRAETSAAQERLAKEGEQKQLKAALEASEKEEEARGKAEERRIEAEKQTEIAREQKKEAVRQQHRAEQQTEIAKEQRKKAEENAEIANQQRQEAVKQRDQALRTQSLFLADVANQRTAAGETRQGILLALEALPRDPQAPDRPFVAQAEAALYRALTASREAAVFKDHKDKVKYAAFAPSGRSIVTSSLDGTAKLWDVNTRNLISSFSAEPDLLIRHVSFSPDGTKLLTSSFSHARLWEISSGKQVSSLSGAGEYINSILQSEFSGTGDLIISRSIGKVRLWDPLSGQEVQLPANIQRGGTPIAIDRNYTRVLTRSEDGRTRLWDAKKGSELALVGNAAYRVEEATFAPDGKRFVAYNASEGGTLRLWDASTGTEVAVLEGHSGVVSAYFSPSGDRLVTHGWDSKISSGLSYHDLPRLWTRDGAPIKSLQGHEGPVTHVAFSPNGELFATASKDGTVRIWKSFNGTEVTILRGHRDEVLHVEFSPDSFQILTTSADKTARLWDIGDVNLIAILPAVGGGRYAYVDLNSEARRLITGYDDGTIALWDTSSWTLVSTARGHKSYILTTAWSSDKTRFVTAAKDGLACLWDARTGAQLAAYEGHKGMIRDVNFDPQESRLISAGDDGTARIWDLKSGSQVALIPAHKQGVKSAFFLKDGRYVVTVSFDFILSERVARLWDTSDGSLLNSFHGPLCWKEVGTDRTLIASYSDDGVLRVWDLDHRREISRLDGALQGDDANITASAFSADGKYLAVGSANGTARIWQVDTGAKVSELHGHESADFKGTIKHVSFSPDGKYVVTGSVDRSARLWEIKTGVQVALSPDHDDWVTNAVFDSVGKHIITIGGGVRLWDAESSETIFSIPKEKLGFIVESYLVDDGRILMVMDSEEISLFGMFPSKRTSAFPTTSALVEFAKRIPLIPLTDDERRRFFIPSPKDE